MDTLDRFRGCLLGGAIGDALGAPVEFLRHAEIVRRFGAEGILDYVPAYGVNGAITDDTQMTLFTGEGLLRAYVRGRSRGISSFRSVTDHAYLRWLETQGHRAKVAIEHDGWLWGVDALHHARAPGNTCLSALMAKKSFGEAVSNDSKGCGGVMRVAPVGMYLWHQKIEGVGQRTFDLAAELAGLTHGHPSGQWSAGVLAVLVRLALDGVSIREALPEAKDILRTRAGHEETLAAIEVAEALAESGRKPSAREVERLGEGWVAEEALAIALYCAMVAESAEEGIALAVNHGGDSDSTGSIAGNLLGALHGESALPQRWLDCLELRDVVTRMANDLYEYPEWLIGEYASSEDNQSIWNRYPGG